jgi:hypothetical protein
VRFTFPRLRIDQLMSFCWKVLIPLAFLQIFLNGLVITYDWPDGLLFVTSGAGLLLAFYIIYRVVRTEPRTVTLVPANPRLAGRGAAAQAEATS